MNKEWFPKYDQTKFYTKLVEDMKIEIPENFNEMRKFGENDTFICKLILEDSIKDFIVFVNKNNISIDANINVSIYETNQLMNEMNNVAFHIYDARKRITLIEIINLIH